MSLKKQLLATIYSNNATDTCRYVYLGLVMLLAWVGYLQWQVYNLSAKLQELDVQNNVKPPYGTLLEQNNINEKNATTYVETIPQNRSHPAHRISVRRAKRGGSWTRSEIRHYIKRIVNNKDIIYMHGTKQQQNNEFFQWDPESIGIGSKIIYNLNGTVTLNTSGYFMVFTQITVRGQRRDGNLLSYGYETVLIKRSGTRNSLMSSFVTQENRGNLIHLTSSRNAKNAVDSLSHSVVDYFEINDQIGIRKIPRNSYINFTQTWDTSYFGILQISI